MKVDEVPFDQMIVFPEKLHLARQFLKKYRKKLLPGNTFDGVKKTKQKTF